MSNRSSDIRHKRSELLRRTRQFFFDRDFLEVATPLLLPEVIPELHIEPIQVHSGDTTHRRPAMRSVAAASYLQASPELCMKRLLCNGATAIFQITRSFRAGERGRLHSPEFTIVEWYRVGDDMTAGIALLDELCQSLLDTPPAIRSRYANVFERALGICPHTCSVKQLAMAAQELGIDLPDGIDRSNRDAWLNLLLATKIEPQLGERAPEIVYDYPASQAALAIIRDDGDSDTQCGGPAVAERFELYYRGVELANGYHELTDATELRQRLEQVNVVREASGRPALPLPESLFAAMERGMPNCAGCALGFDRLLMLATGAESIEDVSA